MTSGNQGQLGRGPLSRRSADSQPPIGVRWAGLEAGKAEKPNRMAERNTSPGNRSVRDGYPCRTKRVVEDDDPLAIHREWKRRYLPSWFFLGFFSSSWGLTLIATSTVVFSPALTDALALPMPTSLAPAITT